MTNYDEDLLVGLRVDPQYDEPILHQVLRIAMYDEFHAYETYRKVIDTFGPADPFVRIMEAEIRHYTALEPLLRRYGVPEPVDNWYEKIELPPTLVECCEVGVAAEIDNVLMYDNLLMYTREYPDIQDVLYRLQAASRDHHLPAFRQCVQRYSAAPVDIDAIYSTYSSHQIADESILAQLSEVGNLMKRAAAGEIDQSEVMKFLSNTNLAFWGGLAAGAAGAVLIPKLLEELAKNDKEA